MAAQEQILIKILSIGDPEVGKSCLIKRYCEGRFISRYIPTIGVDYGVKKTSIKQYNVNINFFDLSGESDYLSISKEFVSDAQGILLMYDPTDQKSYMNLAKWEKILKEYEVDLKKNICFIIQTKNDLKNKEVKNVYQISSEEGRKFASARSLDFYQTSANNGENVTEVMDRLIQKVIERFDEYRSIYIR